MPIQTHCNDSSDSARLLRIASIIILLGVGLLGTTATRCAAQADAASAKAVRPTILSANNARAKVGERLSHRIVSNGSPANYFAQNLPMEFSINCATGEISGVPITPRVINFFVEAVNPAGKHMQEITFTVAPDAPKQ